ASVTVPLIRENVAIGILDVYRDRAQPYTPREIALVETFADQAVIAIENARLFQELEQRNRELSESLDHQTPLAEILRAIASAPTDLDGVLQTVARTARRLCGGDTAGVEQVVGDRLKTRAFDTAITTPTSFDYLTRQVGTSVSRASVSGCAFVER